MTKQSELEAKLDKILDLDYDKEEYKNSEYLYRADWGGVDKIVEIEEQYVDDEEVWDDDFDTFWKFYVKNLVEFDTKANLNKEKFQKWQFVSIIFTLITPQIISFLALIDWGNAARSTIVIAVVPLILTFLSALFVSFLAVRKFEPLFMNYRQACEKLKNAAFILQSFETDDPLLKKRAFIREVIRIVEEQHAGFEGIFA